MEEYYELLKEGANLDFANEKGFTPLMHVAKNKEHTLLQLIAHNTTLINAEDEDGNSALYYAVEANDLDGVKILYEYGAKITDFIYMVAVHNKQKDIIKFFDQQDDDKNIFL